MQNADGARRPKWTEHGSFLVYRKLEQDVAKWNLDIVNDAETRKIDPHLLAAKIVGRWKSGMSRAGLVAVTPANDPAKAAL